MLETKIEKLTDAIERLIVALNSTEKPAAPPASEKAKSAESAETPSETEKNAITKDDLQAWALAKVREDKSFKTDLMEELSARGAKTISQLADNKAAQEVYMALGGEV